MTKITKGQVYKNLRYINSFYLVDAYNEKEDIIYFFEGFCRLVDNNEIITYHKDILFQRSAPFLKDAFLIGEENKKRNKKLIEFYENYYTW